MEQVKTLVFRTSVKFINPQNHSTTVDPHRLMKDLNEVTRFKITYLVVYINIFVVNPMLHLECMLSFERFNKIFNPKLTWFF